MKIYTKGSKAQDVERLIEKTRAEFEVVQGLNIESIVKYHEFNDNAIWTKSNGETKQVCYTVMDPLEGVELLDFMNSANEDEMQADPFFRYIFLKIGNAIHQLHKAGIAHRDIKLENIMITKDFEIKLIDFGYSIALAGRNESGFMKSRVGTYMYMAPEV